MSKKPTKQPGPTPNETEAAISSLDSAIANLQREFREIKGIVEEIDARTEHLTPQIRSESGPSTASGLANVAGRVLNAYRANTSATVKLSLRVAAAICRERANTFGLGSIQHGLLYHLAEQCERAANNA